MLIFAQSVFTAETPVYIPTGLQNRQEVSTLYLNIVQKPCMSEARDGL